LGQGFSFGLFEEFAGPSKNNEKAFFRVLGTEYQFCGALKQLS